MRTTTTMKAKFTSMLLALIMVFSIIPFGAFTAFAADTPSYVALGDSISTGYGLEDYTVGTTPTNSFTYLLADNLGYELTNLAVDGNTAAGVLAQLEDTEDTSVKTAVADADLITITAGGNDLMALLYQAIADQYNEGKTEENKITAAQVPVILISTNDSRQMSLMNYAMGLLNPETDIYLIDDPEFAQAVAAYIATLKQVTAGILADNPDATIVVATQYNPYVEFKGAYFASIINLTPIYSGMEAGVTALNTAIKNNAENGGYIVADVKAAFDAYTGTGDLYNAAPTSLNIDFHPTAAGHAIIAETFAAAVPVAQPEIYVGGVGMADGDYLANGATSTATTAPASGGYAHYKDGVLTLNNYSYSGAGYVYDSFYGYTSVIYSPNALNIVLQGENAITNTENDSNGITAMTDLTISGSGSIDITADYGVYVDDSDITISGGSIDITSTYGIYLSAIDGADITINGGTLNIAAEYGIVNDYGSVNFNGGTTTVDASGIWGSTAVFANGSITLGEGMEILQPTGAEIGTEEFGGTVISDSDGNTDIKVIIGASGSTPPTPSAADIYVGGVGMADGDYLANGATSTTTTAPESGGYAYYKDGTLTLNNYVYEGEGYLYDSDDYYTSVIYAPGELAIVLQGENSIANTENYCDGITLESGVTISGSGSIDITAHYGIYSYDGDITIDSGTLNITANRGISGVTGSVYFNGGMTVIDARGGKHTVSATGGIKFKNGIEILEPSGAEIVTDEEEPEVICNSDGDKSIYIVIGASGTTPPPSPVLAIYVGGVKMADGAYLANGATETTTTAPESGGYAHYANGTLTLNNYEYEGKGYAYEGYTSVIYSPDALTIVLQGENSITNTEDHSDGITLESGATITGNGGIDITSYYGIYVWDDALKIDSGSIDITAKSGIVCEEGSVSFNGGTTTIDATEGYNTVSATGGIIFKDGIEILEPAGSEIVTDEYDYKVISDSYGNSNLKVVIGANSAAPVPEIYVGGVGMADGTYLANGATSTTTTAPANGGYAYYKDGTLTLNNYSYSGAGYSYTPDYSSVIYALDKLEIVLVGQSSITNTADDGDGITPEADLTVSGDGSIDITACYGIYAYNCDVTVSGGTLNIHAEDGISTEDGSVYFNGGMTVIDARGGYLAVSAEGDIIFKDGIGILEPSDATIEIESGRRFICDSNGDTDIYVVIGASGTTPPPPTVPAIYVGGVGMADGTYLANGATSTTTTAPATGGYAHYKDGVLTLNNYVYEGSGYSYADYYYSAIYAPGELEIVLVGQSSITNTEDDSDGITPEADLTVSGDGSIDINATYGIYSYDGDVTLEGGKLGITGELSGIYAEDDITINGGILDIAAESGIVSEYGSVSFNGGTTTVDSRVENGIAVGASVDINISDENGVEILEPEGAEVDTVVDGDTDFSVIRDSDGNRNIRVVIGTNSAAPEALTGTVTITGDMQVGSTLTATVTDTNNTGELSYQWYRYVENNTAIEGATDSTYTLTADDIGFRIYCVVSSSVQTGSIQEYASGAVTNKEYTITFKYPTFELGFPVSYGASFNEAHPDTVQDMVAAKDHHTFIGWYESTDGGNTLKDTPYDFNAEVMGDVTLYPLFEKNTYTVDIGECHYAECIISGGGSYEHGQTVTLTAAPADGIKFEYWLDTSVQLGDEPTEAELRAAIVSYDATYTFTATENVSLEAVFSVPVEIGITPMLIAGTDESNLLDAEWMDVDYDLGTITPGAEQIVLPGEVIDEIITIGEQQYRFAGFIFYGYDEATETETVELKETLTIGAMPLYNSAEYWDWLALIPDGLYAAYMEYTPENPENPNDPTDPENPNDPTDPENPDDPTDPENPNDPTDPEAPEDPSDPEAPEEPTDPENPDDPTDPENPDDPTDPDAPEDPSDPEAPEEPTDPDAPEEPSDPEAPEEPTDPEAPEEPSDPEAPDDPTDPEAPEEPSDPEAPDDPSDPEAPEDPSDPEAPEEPQNPTAPQTGDNMALWFAFLFISGGAVITLTIRDSKRRKAGNSK